MIHDEICTYEVAKLAKEKGFREKCIEHYYDDTKDWYRSSNPQCYNFGGNTSDAPTQSLLQRWLREEKKIYVYIVPYNIAGEILYIGRAIAPNQDDELIPRFSDTYELALEDALKLALENFV